MNSKQLANLLQESSIYADMDMCKEALDAVRGERDIALVESELAETIDVMTDGKCGCLETSTLEKVVRLLAKRGEEYERVENDADACKITDDEYMALIERIHAGLSMKVGR